MLSCKSTLKKMPTIILHAWRCHEEMKKITVLWWKGELAVQSVIVEVWCHSILIEILEMQQSFSFASSTSISPAFPSVKKIVLWVKSEMPSGEDFISGLWNVKFWTWSICKQTSQVMWADILKWIKYFSGLSSYLQSPVATASPVMLHWLS